MSRLMICLVGLWALTGNVSSAQTDLAPYIYYFSDILSAFIIERADGTDSRKIGQGIIPPEHNSVEFVSWSSSGRWFVYSSYRISPNSSFSSERDPIQVGIFSADGKTHILLSDDTTADFGFAWSPVDDGLFLSYRRESISYIRVIDPSLNRDIIDEQRIERATVCYRRNAVNCRWSDDGTQVYFVDSLGLYDLEVATGIVTERLSFDRYFENNMTLNDRLTFIDGDEVIVHDLTTQTEWRYPKPISEVGMYMEISWNPQYTAAVVKYPIFNGSNSEMLYFWLVLGEETLVPLSLSRDSRKFLLFHMVYEMVTRWQLGID